MGDTSIQWTDKTWNPVRGCSRVSEGCRNCYAERQAARFASAGRFVPDSEFGPEIDERPGPFHGFVQITNGHPQWTGKVELVEKHLEDPLHWRKPCKVFVNSMSDLFHEALSDEAIDRVFAVMALCPQHTFQILTKRPERMLKYLTRGVDDEFMRETMDEAAQEFQACHANMNAPERWPLPNAWLGVSVEDQKTADGRIPLLLQTPAAVRFVSYEPALGPVDFNIACAHATQWNLDPHKTTWFEKKGRIGKAMQMLDWVIVGGESGPGARPFDIAWARNTIKQCKAAGVACFVKQVGSDPRESNANGSCRNFDCTHPDCGWVKLAKKDRKGGDWAEWPEDLRVREFPKVA